MLQIVEKIISETSSQKLLDLQKEIDLFTERNEQKEQAEKMWKNRTDNKVFDEIRLVLGEMCKGNERCCYCEDARAYTIEHIFPKSIYPEKTFVWSNYLYICGDCNSTKNNFFPVFTDTISFKLAKLEDSTNYDVVLLNPRKDNPLEYFELDLTYFQFVSKFDDNTTREATRAEQTLKILELNADSGRKGEILTNQRKNAFESFRSHLYRYRELKAQSNIVEMENVKRQICRTDHPTVWHEIKRYYVEYSDYFRESYKDMYDIFKQLPELLEIECV